MSPSTSQSPTSSNRQSSIVNTQSPVHALKDRIALNLSHLLCANGLMDRGGLRYAKTLSGYRSRQAFRSLLLGRRERPHLVYALNLARALGVEPPENVFRLSPGEFRIRYSVQIPRGDMFSPQASGPPVGPEKPKPIPLAYYIPDGEAAARPNGPNALTTKLYQGDPAEREGDRAPQAPVPFDPRTGEVRVRLRQLEAFAASALTTFDQIQDAIANVRAELQAAGLELGVRIRNPQSAISNRQSSIEKGFP